MNLNENRKTLPGCEEGYKVEVERRYSGVSRYPSFILRNESQVTSLLTDKLRKPVSYLPNPKQTEVVTSVKSEIQISF